MVDAAVVLAGGRSSRMGTTKAALRWHGSTLLHRTVSVLARTVPGPVVVVRAPGQELPPLPAGTELVADPVAGRGPMQGVAAGLAAVRERAERAFVCSTDLPFLHPAFVRRVLSLLDDPAIELVFPVARGYRQPLAAGYRTRLAGLLAQLVEAGDLRPGMLLTHCATALPGDAELLSGPAGAELAGVDPALESVINVNTPEDYAAALARPAPLVSVDGRSVRAATLRQAGVSASDSVLLNGVEVAADPELPLVAGDAVVFLRD
jgi:molybdopterin-guanine dinucleotide biosynthesis protein A